MEHEVHAVVIVSLDFQEMVAAAERAQGNRRPVKPAALIATGGRLWTLNPVGTSRWIWRSTARSLRESSVSPQIRFVRAIWTPQPISTPMA
jgi:hypothetical protein